MVFLALVLAASQPPSVEPCRAALAANGYVRAETTIRRWDERNAYTPDEISEQDLICSIYMLGAVDAMETLDRAQQRAEHSK